MELLTRFVAHADRDPAAPALLVDDTVISRGDLAAATARFARVPSAVGLQPGDRIAFHRLPTGALPAVLLGIWAAGAVAVPLEEHLPVPAIRELLVRSGASLLIASGGPGRSLARVLGDGWSVRTVLLDAPADWDGPRFSLEGPRLRIPPIRSTELASILFTSGSTGAPKGVCVSRRAVDAFVLHWAERLAVGRDDRVLQGASPAFDLSLFEVGVPAVSGAVGVPLPASSGAFPATEAERIRTSGATVWYAVPSRIVAAFDAGGPVAFAGLRALLYAGEPLGAGRARTLAQLPDLRLFNLFGPTETNVSTAYELPPDFAAAAVPIGRPCPYVEVLLDGGELLVTGDTVTPGYWGEPDRAVFVRRFGRRWLRTGDRAVLGVDGLLRFRGRMDRMVKVRGYRVEPEAVETKMTETAGVTAAAVVVVDDVLVGWFEGDADPDAVLGALRRALPSWSVPETIERRSLPRTPRGKVDLSAVRTGARGSER